MAGGKINQFSSKKTPLKVTIVKKKKKRNQTLERPIATKLVTTLRYAEAISIAPSVAGTASSYVFSLNGLHNPDITTLVGDHQPRGFDQLMALYEHYVVLGVKISVQCACDNTQTPITIAISQQAGNNPDFNIYNIMENHNVKMATRGRLMTGPLTMTMKVNPNKFLGRSSPLSDPQLKGDVNNNPAESSYLHINTFQTDTTATPSYTTHMIVTLDYITAFIEPKKVGIS